MRKGQSDNSMCACYTNVLTLKIGKVAIPVSKIFYAVMIQSFQTTFWVNNVDPDQTAPSGAV